MPWGQLIGMAASYLAPRALDALFGGQQQIDHQQAMKQARAALDPQFQRTLDDTLAGLDRQAMGRGFYGQMPADALRRSTAADLAMQHQGQLAQYAHGMHDRQLQQAQMALQGWQGIGQYAGQAVPEVMDAIQQRDTPWPWQRQTNPLDHSPVSPALEALGTTGPHSGGAAGTLLRGSPVRPPGVPGTGRYGY